MLAIVCLEAQSRNNIRHTPIVEGRHNKTHEPRLANALTLRVKRKTGNRRLANFNLTRNRIAVCLKRQASFHTQTHSHSLHNVF